MQPAPRDTTSLTPATSSAQADAPVTASNLLLTPQAAPTPAPTEPVVTEPTRYAPGFAAKLNLSVDVVLVVAALLVSTLLMHPSLRVGSGELWALLGVGIITWLVVGTTLCLYDVRFADRDALDDMALLSVQVMAVTVVLYVSRLLIARESGIVALTFFPPLLWTSVALLRLLLFRRLAVREQPLDEVIVVGIGPMGRATGEDITQRGRQRVIGHLRFSNETYGSSAPEKVLARAEQLEHILSTVPVDEVYIAGNVLKNSAEMQAAVKLCEKLGMPFALPAHPFRLDRARPADSHVATDGYLHFVTHAPQPHQMALKRLFDIISSGAALVALSPLLIGVALAVKFTSRGPIFFKQKRVGLHGKPFHMLKFRSMVVNAEELKAKLEALNEQTGPVFKMKNDPRITRIGRFIRKYSIDELPQLINVLRGEMSVVGPRPPIPSEVAKYAAWQRRRLSVRPGLTCIWQVSGRNQISFEQWMYLDMQYIDHWSLKNDINLILKTVPVVLTGSGAS